MKTLPNFPPIHFDFGAIAELPGILSGLGVNRPLVITDTGLVARGIAAKLVTLPGTVLIQRLRQGLATSVDYQDILQSIAGSPKRCTRQNTRNQSQNQLAMQASFNGVM